MQFTPPPSLDVQVTGPTVTLALNRPAALNALDMELRRELGRAILAFEADPALRVAILTGAGGRAFSAGDDLKEMAEGADRAAAGNGSPAPTFEVGRLGQVPGFDQVRECRKPLIAAIDGWCLAGGFELAMYCDLRLATRGSRFGLPEPRRGLLPGPGLHDLPRLVPLGEALRILLTGGHLEAERAHQIGLVQELAGDRDELLARAHALADEISACAPSPWPPSSRSSGLAATCPSSAPGRSPNPMPSASPAPPTPGKASEPSPRSAPRTGKARERATDNGHL